MKPDDDILTIILMAIAWIMVVACVLIGKKISDKYDKDRKE